MQSPGHNLPSGPLRTQFTAFFNGAKLARNGSIQITFLVSPESNAALLDLSEGDGMALNVSVWDTELPEGDQELASWLGLDGQGNSED